MPDPSTDFNSGAAYVFRRTETDWQLEAYLKASNTNERDFFGSTTVACFASCGGREPRSHGMGGGLRGFRSWAETVSPYYE